MSKFPRILLVLCHGKTEITFFSEIIERYIELKFNDLFGEEIGYYKNNNENPNIIFGYDHKNETYVSVNAFESNIKSLLEATEFRHELSKSEGIHVLTIIDIYEDDIEKPARRQEILSNHYEIISSLCKELDINIDNSQLIFSKIKLRIASDFYDITFGMKGPKQSKILKWSNYKIDEMWENRKLSPEKIKDLVSKIKNSNINELIEKIDEWFDWIEEGE